MEIPNINKYNNIEKPKGMDFLDEKTRISFSFDDEVAKFLPKITDEELETKQEKYHVLLGNIQYINNDEMNINIKGILEADKNEKDLFYSENKGHVSPDLKAIQKWVKSIQESIPEYKDFHFIGDVHTHPAKPSELNESVHPCDPSTEDFEDICSEYQNDNLSPDKPFIFCIAGRENEQTVYAFYRIIKENEKFKIEKIEKK